VEGKPLHSLRASRTDDEVAEPVEVEGEFTDGGVDIGQVSDASNIQSDLHGETKSLLLKTKGH
jgi:hypothetical protein